MPSWRAAYAQFRLARALLGHIGNRRSLLVPAISNRVESLLCISKRLRPPIRIRRITRLTCTRIIGHDGGVPQFSAKFALLSEEDVSLFVVAHGSEAYDAKQEVADALLERYAPVESSGQRHSPDGTPERAAELGGRYRSVNATDTVSSEKLVFAFFTGQPIDVRVADDGRLITEQGDSTDE